MREGEPGSRPRGWKAGGQGVGCGAANGVRKNRPGRIRNRAGSYDRRARKDVLLAAAALNAGHAKLCADILSKLSRRRHDASFDFHLRRLAIELPDQVIDGRDRGWNIADDQRIGPRIRYDVATIGQEWLEHLLDALGTSPPAPAGTASAILQTDLSVAERAGNGDGSNGTGFCLLQVHAGLRFALPGLLAGAQKHIAIQLLIEIVVLQHDVERLIPGHLIEHQREVALYRGIEHDVQAADLVNQTEEILQVHILEVHVDRLA